MEDRTLPGSSEGKPLDAGCRLCGESTLISLYHINSVTVERCSACGFSQVRERPDEQALSELYSQSYFNHGKYDGDWSSHKERARRMRCLSRLKVESGARVLDAGCATGDFMAHGAEQFEMWGVDISADAVDQARKRLPDLADHLFSGPLETLSLPEDYFDAIVLWDVVEHLWDPVACLTYLSKVLRQGGVLALSTPNIGAPSARLMGAQWPFMTPPEHLGFFDKGTMHTLLERAGFQCEHWVTSGKWTTADFLVYKIHRINARWVPAAIRGERISRFLHQIPIYVPSGDVQYVCARLN
jgi:2-polyprenyl-3-methyl-5-hydroxy-6-metoxy-1,4-benzoquinol methylase